MIGKSLKYSLFLSMITITAHAQIGVGLRESALGNSGVAITESSAPSHYNPALLSERQNSYFSLTGTTLSSFQTSDEGGTFNSTKFAPNYLSSIHAFDSFVHEFSLANQISLDSRVTSAIPSGSRMAHIRVDHYTLGYAFAFRDFPFGFQLGLRIKEQSVNLSQDANDGTVASGIDVQMLEKKGNVFFGFGGIHQFGSHYRFGYKYESQGLKVYDKFEQSGAYYYYDKNTNTFSTGQSMGQIEESGSFNTQILTLGHSFSAGDHEFLTDSRFTETDDRDNKFEHFQTFGYRLKFSNKMQFMTGLSYDFGNQGNYFSAGYSWLTNTLRSTVSAYYADDDRNMKTSGLTFGSEFVY